MSDATCSFLSDSAPARPATTISPPCPTQATMPPASSPCLLSGSLDGIDPNYLPDFAAKDKP